MRLFKVTIRSSKMTGFKTDTLNFFLNNTLYLYGVLLSFYNVYFCMVAIILLYMYSCKQHRRLRRTYKLILIQSCHLTICSYLHKCSYQGRTDLPVARCFLSDNHQESKLCKIMFFFKFAYIFSKYYF